MQVKDLPKNWPDHLDVAIKNLSDHILPTLKFSTNKLLLAIPTAVPPNVDPKNIPLPTDNDIALHLSIAEQQCLDGYNSVVNHAAHRKARFDTKVIKWAPKNVMFKRGDLMQVHQTQWHNTFLSMRKLTPMWSISNRVTSCLCNLYTLEMLRGLPIEGTFSTKQLHAFEPRPGTKLTLEELRSVEDLDLPDNDEDGEAEGSGIEILWDLACDD